MVMAVGPERARVSRVPLNALTAPRLESVSPGQNDFVCCQKQIFPNIRTGGMLKQRGAPYRDSIL